MSATETQARGSSMDAGTRVGHKRIPEAKGTITAIIGVWAAVRWDIGSGELVAIRDLTALR